MEAATNTATVIDIEPEGTWVVPVSLGRRWAEFAWRMGIASAITVWLFYEQFQNNASAPYMLWGFGIFSLGTFFGVRAFGIRERRVFDSTEAHYTHVQRIKRAARWFLPGLVGLAFVWSVQLSSDQFSAYWWYAWPVLFPLLVGGGLYMLRSERVLSEKGQSARALVAANKARAAEQRNASLRELAGSGLVRYPVAAGCTYLAYVFATETTGKDTVWAVLGCVVLAVVLARELAMWLLGALVVGLVAWAFIAGLGALNTLPVSTAIIIGALIIAMALNNK